MKTYFFSGKRLSIYSVFGLIAFVVSSCGSYQNSSYYDGDGVYGNSQSNKREVSNKDNSQSSKYQEYFSDLNKDSQAFTDVDQYTSVSNDTIKRTENYNNNNSSWGSNPQSVTVNVYDSNWGYGYWNNYWYGNYWGYNNWWYGPGWGWGWNSWYGPSLSFGWGWGSPYYGYYGPYYGGYYGYYGNHYYNNYYYNGGRRGRVASGYGVFNGGRNGRSSIYNDVNGGRRGNTFGNNSSTRNTFSSNTRSTYNYPVRNTTNTTYNSSTRSNTYTPSTRSNDIRTQSSTPVRSYTPSSSGTRSSFGGGGGGFGGGGRSSGGGRR